MNNVRPCTFKMLIVHCILYYAEYLHTTLYASRTTRNGKFKHKDIFNRWIINVSLYNIVLMMLIMTHLHILLMRYAFFTCNWSLRNLFTIYVSLLYICKRISVPLHWQFSTDWIIILLMLLREFCPFNVSIYLSSYLSINSANLSIYRNGIFNQWRNFKFYFDDFSFWAK